MRLKKPMDFIGRDSLIKAKDNPVRQSIISILSKDPDCPPAWGGELILCNGRPIGEITSAAYGYSLNGVIALGLVKSTTNIDRNWIEQHEFEMEISGNRHPVHVSLSAFYEPSNQFMRA